MNRERGETLTALVFLVVLALITFWRSFNPEAMLSTGDVSWGLLHSWKSALPESFLGNRISATWWVSTVDRPG